MEQDNQTYRIAEVRRGGTDKTRVVVDLDPQGSLSSWPGDERILLVDVPPAFLDLPGSGAGVASDGTGDGPAAAHHPRV